MPQPFCLATCTSPSCKWCLSCPSAFSILLIDTGAYSAWVRAVLSAKVELSMTHKVISDSLVHAVSPKETGDVGCYLDASSCLAWAARVGGDSGGQLRQSYLTRLLCRLEHGHCASARAIATAAASRPPIPAPPMPTSRLRLVDMRLPAAVS